MCGWRRGWRGPWPGGGPFSHLPPWERPGRIYGPGACGRLYAPRPYSVEPKPAEELETLRAYVRDLKQELEGVEASIKELTAAKDKK